MVKKSTKKTKKEEASQKPATIKSVRNVTISFLLLFFIVIGAGITYTWYVGQNSNVSDLPDLVLESTSGPAIIKPSQPASNSPNSAAVRMISSPIIPGSDASITVKTNPKSECNIKAEYNKIPSTDSGLVKKTADEYGIVSWDWHVENSVPLGKWPVTVTCVWNTKAAVVVGDLVVAKSILP